MSKVVVMDHPLIEQKIGIIRRKETGQTTFTVHFDLGR